MDYDTLVVKESPGLCRCCLSEGCYKDLGTEYQWMNDTEVYADMLFECFDISITQHNEGPNGPNRLICEVCITRLRDACNFKKQVLESEKRFIDMIGRREFKPQMLIYQAQIKHEEKLEELPEEEVEYLEDDVTLQFDEDDQKNAIDLDEPLVSEDITVSSLPVKGKRGRPKKATKAKSEKVEKAKVPRMEEKKPAKMKGMKLESKNGMTADVSMLCPQPEAKNLSNKDKLTIMRDNVTQVLLNSTLMPFRWLRSAYRCFYCYEMFQEPKDLKAHQTQHNDQDIPRVMKTYWEPVVYADVSSISCKLCPERIADLNELIDHLTSQHPMRFDQRLKNCFGSFKLNDSSVSCVQCAKTFSSLSHLLIHANKDHIEESRVLCDICGQNFQSASRLRHHTKKEHEDNAVKCTICGEMIGSVNKMRTHLQHAHNKRYKCFLCSDSFETHYKRSRHMMVFHKERKEIKCQYCSRTFVYRSTMVRHVREMHLQEKNAVCNICGWKAFGGNRLQLHMMKHSDVRNFKCTVCDKAFKTKKTMRQHYNNIHQKGIKKGSQVQIST